MKVALLLAALALGASSCGAGKPARSAAEVAPRDTFALIAGRATPELRQALAFLPGWARLQSLLARGRALTASGGDAQIAVLDPRGTRAVAFAHPADRKRLDKQLDAAGIAHAQIRGWTVFARRQATIDFVRHSKQHLAGASWYRAAKGELTFALRGFTVAATHRGGRVVASRTTPGGGSDALQPLAASIPSDAIAAAAFHDGAAVFTGLPFAAQLERGLGLRVADLAAAAPGDAALYARAGVPVPSVTLLAQGGDEASARRIVARLDPNAAPAVPATLDGVAVERAGLGPLDLYYGTFGGRLVLTDDPDVQLRSQVTALAVAGLPEATSAWAYLDVSTGLPGLESLAALAGTSLSPGFVGRVTPLRTVLAYLTHTATHETLGVSVVPR